MLPPPPAERTGLPCCLERNAVIKVEEDCFASTRANSDTYSDGIRILAEEIDRIAAHLARRPHDTTKEVANAVGCSTGVVSESPGWKANQARLREAKKKGKAPNRPTVERLFGGDR